MLLSLVPRFSLIQFTTRFSTASSLRPIQNNAINKSNKIFDEEVERQKSLIARIEKIEVKVTDVKPETKDVVLIMNKSKSTPYDCSRHISELVSKRSVIATVDGQPWDLHRPLEKDCTIRFHHFDEPDTKIVNLAFWRSCSFLLGMVVKRSLKEECDTCLHSWPPLNIRSGSFVYDVSIPSLTNWNPADNELLTMTSVFWKIRDQKSNFQRLAVSPKTAAEIFSSNPIKARQALNMAESVGEVILYRVDDHIDMSVGPMVPNTSYVGRISVTAVHQVESVDGPLYRFQGVGIPSQLRVNHFAFKILMDRAKNINSTSFEKVV